MTITTTRLTRAAGISAAVAGLIFIAVQIHHPPMNVASVTTNDWLVRSTAKVVMAALALAGITGLYLRQVRQTRVLGLVGYLVFGAGYLLMLSTEVIAAFVLPGLAHSSPGYVNNVVVAASGGTPTSSIGGNADALRHRRRRVHGRRSPLRYRTVPGPRPGPVGGGTSRRGRRRHRGPQGAATVVQSPDGCPDRCCPHRPR